MSRTTIRPFAVTDTEFGGYRRPLRPSEPVDLCVAWRRMPSTRQTSLMRVESVNIGSIEEVRYRGRIETTAIFKRPTSDRVDVTVDMFGNDQQADRKAHGGPDRIVYAYALEDLAWWEEQLGRAVPPSSMGENLTTSGLDITNAVIGERWRIGTAIVEVSALRTPCFKLGIRMGIDAFSVEFANSRRPGAYLRVTQPGNVAAGDAIEVVDQPDHGVTMLMLADAYHRDNSLARRLLDAPQLDDGWREWAAETAAKLEV
jgi:MOSC domain-containing protein YiiM